MALLFIDGFDHYDPQMLDPFGQPWLARGKAAYLSPQAQRIPGRRPSSYALRLPAGSGGGYVKNLETGRTSLIVGAALRVAPFENTGEEPVLLGVRDTTAQVTHLVRIGEDGRLKLYRRTGSGMSGWDQLISTSVTTAPARGWHYVELQVVQGTSNGVLSVRVNGILAIQLTAQNTLRGGGPLLTAFVGAVPGQPCPITLDVDDLYLADTSGTTNNTFLGDVRVDALSAQADGAMSQWTVEGAASDWAAVSDGDEASGIRANAAGLRQTFDLAPLPAMATPALHGVQVTMLARKTDAGLGKVKGLVASGAQTAVSADINLQEQLAWHTALFERNPNGNVPWTEAAFNAAEFGVESECEESLASPWAPIDAPAILVEVLRRDTASAAIVATGMEAFGDAPWPNALRDVFAFRHDWAEPLIERLEWQTSVTRLASGNEARQARRRVPRRLLTYTVGHARAGDALVADWLADHLGQRALWPLPQYALHLTEACSRGALALPVTAADSRHFEPPAADLRLRFDGVRGWDGAARWLLILSPDGWQTARLADVEADLLWLADPLARAAGVGSAVLPLVWGRAVDGADLAQWVPGMVDGRVAASLTPAPPPDMGTLDDPLLDGIPVWPDGNWRDDPWPTTTFQRRYLAASPEAIERWRARLWRAQGRLGACWLPDGLAPVLRVQAEAGVEAGYLRVDAEANAAFWHRPAAALIVHPDGTRQHVLTGAFHRDDAGVLVLRTGLDAPVPVGSRVVRLSRCRLDHDAVELYWHSPTLVEIPLTLRRLPEPRGNDRNSHTPS